MTDAIESPDSLARVQRACGDAYEVRALLGMGGFAEVYAARDVRLKRDVAIKVLRADLIVSSALLERFRREVEAVASLRHPHIVPVFSVGEGDGVAYYVMPLVEGRSLREVLEAEGALAPAEARRILSEAAGALEAAHEAGIVHRDIKPENIMLEGRDRRVQLMDFGIAKVMEAEGGSLTGTGFVIGTPDYMSPEQASGEKHIDHRSDLYALGLVGFELLAGRRPFEADSAQQMILHHIATPAPDLRKLAPLVPPDLAAAVGRCLSKRPDERWATARELRETLEAGREATPAKRRPWRAPQRGRGWILAARLIAWGLVAPAVLIFAFLQTQTGEAMRRWALGGALPPAPAGPWTDLQTQLGAGPPFSLGDSLLVVTVNTWHSNRLLLFDGRQWRARVLGGLGLFPVLFVRAGHVYLLDQWNGRIDEWTGSRIVPAVQPPDAGQERSLLDRPRFGAALGRGDDIIVGSWNGGVFRFTGGRWRREATGTSHAVRQIFGRDSTRLFALTELDPANVGDARADSLLEFNGVSWRLVDAHPEPGVRAHYSAGAVLDDGAVMVTGDECRGRNCRPMVLARGARDTVWASAARGLPDDFRVFAAWGPSLSDYFVWGFRTGRAHGFEGWACEPNDECVFHVLHGRGQGVAELRGHPIVGIAKLHGTAHAVAFDGTVWALSGDRWGVATELPASTLRDVAASRDGWLVAGNNGGLASHGWLALSAERAHSPVTEDFIRVVVADSGVYVLSSAGRLFTRVCAEEVNRLPTGKDRTATVCRPVEAPAALGARLTDVAPRSGGGLVAVGANGYAAFWDGQSWRRETLPGVVSHDSLRRVVSAHGVVGAVGTAHLLLRDSAGVWTAIALPDRLRGAVQDMAVAADGRVLLVGIGRVYYHRDRWYWADVQGAPSRIHALDDGRVVVGTANDDPLVGGRLFVLSSDLHSVAEVALPLPTQVRGIADDGTRLYVVGSGWFSQSLRLSSLPVPTGPNQ